MTTHHVQSVLALEGGRIGAVFGHTIARRGEIILRRFRFVLKFNGRNSRLNLSIYGTPSGPLSVKVSVRPRRFGGNIYTDAGGMWVSTDGEGHIQWVRLGGVNPIRWVTTQSQSVIPLGEWSDLECIWDGKRLRIFINGRADGEAECPPLFSSWRRAVGYNPFGTGSGYFEGDVDDLTIRSIPGVSQ
ncbi:MAG: hypothetical protein EOO38_24905 [Cytophagaceae bacterium]|nr:MAG: hypothetical protein EOO38_24905 [Cytophagaceae bacterium]